MVCDLARGYPDDFELCLGQVAALLLVAIAAWLHVKGLRGLRAPKVKLHNFKAHLCSSFGRVEQLCDQDVVEDACLYRDIQL
jgi:ABC-type nickel/cobalt efflux system permease component RcnA